MLMQQLNFYNAKQKKELFQQLEEQFGVKPELDLIFFENSQDKVFLLSKDYAHIDTSNLRVNNSGMYFAKKERDGIRLTLEGAQLLQNAKKKLILTKKQTELWMQGEDISLQGNEGFVILEHEGDIFGCGMHKNNILRNMVPKERRLHSVTQTEE